MDNRVWVKDAVMTIRLPEEVDHFVADRLREEELIGGKVRAVHVGERMRRILVMSGVTRVIEVEEEKTWK